MSICTKVCTHTHTQKGTKRLWLMKTVKNKFSHLSQSLQISLDTVVKTLCCVSLSSLVINTTTACYWWAWFIMKHFCNSFVGGDIQWYFPYLIKTLFYHIFPVPYAFSQLVLFCTYKTLWGKKPQFSANWIFFSAKTQLRATTTAITT